jgi:hypothetical protein
VEDSAVKKLGLVLILGAALVFVCGCPGKKDSSSGSGGGSGSSTKAMDLTTPEAAFESFKGVVARGDYGAAFDKMLCKQGQDKMDEGTKMFAEISKEDPKEFETKMGMKPEDYLKLSARDRFVKLGKQMEKDPAEKARLDKFKSAGIVECKKDGDKATLKYKSGQGDGMEVEMLNEGGTWKFVELPKPG